jgi:hypothetical protein
VLGGGLLGAGVNAIFGGGKKKKTVAQPLPTATRDDGAALAQQEDELRRRKGSAADILTGSTGAEAALSGGKLVLGS